MIIQDTFLFKHFGKISETLKIMEIKNDKVIPVKSQRIEKKTVVPKEKIDAIKNMVTGIIGDGLKKRIVSKGMDISQILAKLKAFMKEDASSPKLIEKIRTLRGQYNRLKDIKDPITQKQYDYSMALLDILIDVDNDGKILTKSNKRENYKDNLISRDVLVRLNRTKKLTDSHGSLSKRDLKYITEAILEPLVKTYVLNNFIGLKKTKSSIPGNKKIMVQFKSLYDFFYSKPVKRKFSFGRD